MTLNELVSNAEAAHNTGVPVDWRSMCMTVFQAANKQIADLEQQVSELSSEPLEPTAEP